MNSASDEALKQALEQQAKIDKLTAVPVDHTEEALKHAIEVEKLKSGFSPFPEPKQPEPSDFHLPRSPQK